MSTSDDSPVARFEADHYWAVIFTNQLANGDEAYERTAERMVELAAAMPGFLGIESVRDAEGRGITVSYWTDPESIAAWKEQAEHRLAQSAGRTRWYSEFATRVCRVERSSYWTRAADAVSTPEPVR